MANDSCCLYCCTFFIPAFFVSSETQPQYSSPYVLFPPFSLSIQLCYVCVSFSEPVSFTRGKSWRIQKNKKMIHTRHWFCCMYALLRNKQKKIQSTILTSLKTISIHDTIHTHKYQLQACTCTYHMPQNPFSHPQPGKLKNNNLLVSGTGCGMGEASHNISRDADTLHATTHYTMPTAAVVGSTQFNLTNHQAHDKTTQSGCHEYTQDTHSPSLLSLSLASVAKNRPERGTIVPQPRYP